MKLTNVIRSKTIIFFLILGFLIGFVLRSVLATNQLNKPAAYSNDFVIEQIQSGHKVRDMVLVKKVPYSSELEGKIPVSSNVTMQFKGEVQITGSYFFSAPMGVVGEGGKVKSKDYKWVCISGLDEQSLNKLPHPVEKTNGTVFCFDNNDYAFEQFSPVGSKGRATVVIDNYTINIYPSEVHDTATLVRVAK